MILTDAIYGRKKIGSGYEGGGLPIGETALIDDPALRYYFQFANNDLDSSGNGYDAIDVKDVLYNPSGKFNRSAVFTRALQPYFRLPDAANYDLTLSYPFWLKFTEDTTDSYSLAKGDSGASWGFLFRRQNTGTGIYYAVVTLNASGGNATQSNIQFAPLNNANYPGFDFKQWHHYCPIVDFEAKIISLYVDGALITSAAIPSTNVKLRGSTGIYLGSGKLFGSMLYSDSEMADAALFQRRLTDSEIAHLALGNPIN